MSKVNVDGRLGELSHAPQQAIRDLAREINLFNDYIKRGTGSPEGVVSAVIGAIYQRTDGGTGTTLYVKQSNSGGNTGWVAK